MSGKIKVLIVDDQEIIRKILSRGLNSSGEIEVIGTAKDAFEARDKIVELSPDVLTLDVEMPKMNGLEFLKKLMPQYPVPVIMVSSHTLEGKAITLEALDAGAVDFVAKPDGSENGFEKTILELTEKIILASKVNVKRRLKKKELSPSVAFQKSFGKSGVSLIAIGASTGGTTAVKEIIEEFSNDMPPIVVVQHMPSGFTKLFAERLDNLCELEVREACEGDKLVSGKVFIAPGDKHVVVTESLRSLYLSLSSKEKVSGHRPSVDVLFQSISELSACSRSIGVILTGMGKDGAAGLKKMMQNGALTIGQDENSSVVYGMPREAFLAGAVLKQASLEAIPNEILFSIQKIQKNRIEKRISDTGI